MENLLLHKARHFFSWVYLWHASVLQDAVKTPEEVREVRWGQGSINYTILYTDASWVGEGFFIQHSVFFYVWFWDSVGSCGSVCVCRRADSSRRQRMISPSLSLSLSPPLHPALLKKQLTHFKSKQGPPFGTGNGSRTAVRAVSEQLRRAADHLENTKPGLWGRASVRLKPLCLRVIHVLHCFSNQLWRSFICHEWLWIFLTHFPSGCDQPLMLCVWGG